MTATLTPPPPRVRTAGWLCAAGALIGMIGGLLLIVVPPAVAPDRSS